jgi:hypothetical protein
VGGQTGTKRRVAGVELCIYKGTKRRDNNKKKTEGEREREYVMQVYSKQAMTGSRERMTRNAQTQQTHGHTDQTRTRKMQEGYA